MIKQTILYVLLLLPMAAWAEGVTYRTQFIENVIRTLKLVPTIESLPCGRSTLRYKGNILCVNINQYKEVDYIGMPLFSKRQRHLQPSPVYDFLEFAYLKYKYNIHSDLDDFRMLSFVKGHWDDMESVNDSTPVTIRNVGGKYFEVEWDLSQKEIIMTFPIRYDMISNSNHIELENNFIKDLTQIKDTLIYNETKHIPSKILPENLFLKGEDSIYVDVGDTLFSKSISTTTFYRLQGKRLFLLDDDSYPSETLSNMFLTGKSSTKRNVNLDIHKMDFTRENVKVKISYLLNILNKQRNINYVSRKRNSNNIELSLYSYNPALGCLHLFTFHSSKPDTLTESMTLKGKAYLYIPVSNIKNLFYEN